MLKDPKYIVLAHYGVADYMTVSGRRFSELTRALEYLDEEQSNYVRPLFVYDTITHD